MRGERFGAERHIFLLSRRSFSTLKENAQVNGLNENLATKHTRRSIRSSVRDIHSEPSGVVEIAPSKAQRSHTDQQVPADTW
jgi:hypothetical protein